MYLCRRCASLTESPIEDRCGRCADWPDYDPADPTLGDLGRLAEHVYGQTGEWTRVAAALIDAMKAARLAG